MNLLESVDLFFCILGCSGCLKIFISKNYYVFDFRDTLKFKYLSSILNELNLYVVCPFYGLHICLI